MNRLQAWMFESQIRYAVVRAAINVVIVVAITTIAGTGLGMDDLTFLVPLALFAVLLQWLWYPYAKQRWVPDRAS